MSLEHNDKIEWVDINTLKPNPDNRNKHPEDQINEIVKQIKYQGWRWPIVVSNRSGLIAAGHGRLLAARKMDLTQVPVIYQDFTDEEQEIAFGVADNAIAKWAELDFAGINFDVEKLGPDFDISLLGIKDFEIEPADKEGLTDPDEVPDKAPPRAKLGDVFLLGEHRLMCGDSTDLAAVERLMAGEKADMVFTDPPYGVAIKNKKGSILGDESLDVFYGCLDPIKSAAKTSAHLYVYFGVQYTKECIDALQRLFKQNNILVQRITHENKPSPDGYFKSNYELCYFSNPGGRPFNHGHLDVSESTLNDSRYEGNGKAKTYPALVEIKATEHNLKSIHPTQKTVEICEFYQKVSSNAGDIVLDLFGGSGSVLIAAEKTNRKCFMMELDEKYCDIIIARWEKFAGKAAVKAEADEKPAPKPPTKTKLKKKSKGKR